MAFNKRLAARYACHIAVQACTPIDTVAAELVDLSRGGAQLRLDRPFAKGARIHLDVDGHYYWATVMWDEVDRIGVRFHGPVRDGPLDEALRRLDRPLPMPRPPSARGEAPGAAGFGRRVAGARR